MDRDLETKMVMACQKGDRKALDTLVRQLEKPVYNAAFRMLGNPDEAADVTQATFVKVFENIQRFDPGRRLFSWTYRIALNESIDQLRRRKRTQPLADTPRSSSDVPQDNVESSQLRDEVQAALMTLNEEQRAVITLRYFSECNYRDIGAILRLPEKTVKSRLFEARRKMRDKLCQHGVFSS
ncbi:MAG: sigma-70 family RNA polymerase sigma factor [Gammaproteobacteria bacterium]|nr:sigma-70 family RNA polymerase sigma factor [Gammaproteobacteria bacterium]MDH3373742.1 sigma-70 family RNA polymerase sigma factor [Gammaproteobacteria bacterium]MDH3410577.1 sigma-70 family RNA polymerase sigma factor [Gammaproteobacteria bacterium]